MDKLAIEVSGLGKEFPGNIQAVGGIDFEVEKGEIFSILGPNGAGKSTTIKILTTLMKPTSGKAKIMGFCSENNPMEIRKLIGVSLQTTAIDLDLTGIELLTLQGRLYGFKKKDARNRALELIRLVNLEKDAKRSSRNYSGGMQRSLDLALSMVHKPKILFLDEPTTGLDPKGRSDLWEEIKKLRDEFNTTIVMTTQYLEEADKMSDRICIIKDGEIISLGNPKELKKSLSYQRVSLSFSSQKDNVRARKVLETGFSIEENQRAIEFHLEGSREKLSLILRTLAEKELFPENISISQPTLDDLFLKLVEKPEKENQKRRDNYA